VAGRAEVLDSAVRVRCAGRAELTRTVLLATGVVDGGPDVPGFADVWGTSAHTCPQHTAGEEHARGACATMVMGLRSVVQDVPDIAARLVRGAARLDGGRSLEECPPPAVRGTGG
jgi:hypothetical protein